MKKISFFFVQKKGFDLVLSNYINEEGKYE